MTIQFRQAPLIALLILIVILAIGPDFLTEKASEKQKASKTAYKPSETATPSTSPFGAKKPHARPAASSGDAAEVIIENLNATAFGKAQEEYDRVKAQHAAANAGQPTLKEHLAQRAQAQNQAK